MKKIFNSPMGPAEYSLERTTLYGTRRVVVDSKTVGILEITEGQRWVVVGLVDSPSFSSQRVAAEYWLMWRALKERNECPYCDTGWEANPVFMDGSGASSVVWKCPECGAMEEHIRWPPPEQEED